MNGVIEELYQQLTNMFPDCNIAVTDSLGKVELGEQCGVFFKKIIETYNVRFVFSSAVLSVTRKNIISHMSDVFIDAFVKQARETASSFDKQGEFELLLNQLFYSNDVRNTSYTSLLAASLGIDLSLPRTICLLQYSITSGEEKLQDEKDDLGRMIKGYLKRHFGTEQQDIITTFKTNQLLLCLSPKTKQPSRKAILEMLREIIDQLEMQYKVDIHIGIGVEVATIPEYHESLKMAQIALHSSYRDALNLLCIEDCYLDYMLTLIPDEILAHFLDYEVNLLGGEMKTIDTLVQNEMDLYSTATKLGIHRNTLVFQIKKIKNLLHLDPLHEDSDRFHLVLLTTYKKYRTENSEF